MPVNLPIPLPETLLPVAGVRLGVAEAGVRKANRKDVTVLLLDEGTTVGAGFTQNRFCAAPVQICREHLAATGATGTRALVINTGNANAGTGAEGLLRAKGVCEALASQLGIGCEQVLPFSTGVIMEQLPAKRVVAGLPVALADAQPHHWLQAAQAIMTTDTRPKVASRQLQLAGRTVTIAGMAKGAGMIRPDMATMLAFIATDAGVDAELLQHLLNDAVAASFNAIPVDGDTSTNDACMLLATGQAGARVPASGEDRERFAAALDEVCIELAQAIIRDGEGATKFITVQVEGGREVAECRQVAYTIAHSPLVKTAFFASDPNWGRILAAVGRAGLEALDLERVDIYLDEARIVQGGGRDPAYTEALGQEVMSRSEITIRVVLGRGAATARIWTTDLSFDYVRINAEYRT